MRILMLALLVPLLASSALISLLGASNSLAYDVVIHLVQQPSKYSTCPSIVVSVYGSGSAELYVVNAKGERDHADEVRARIH